MGGLTGKLTLKLGRRDPELTGKLFRPLAELTGAESALRHKLLGRKASLSLLLKKLTGKLFRRDPHLGGLTGKLTLKLRCRNTKLTRQLLGTLTELTCPKRSGLRQLLCGQSLLTRGLERLLTELTCPENTRLCKLLCRQTCLRGKLFCRKAKLALLLRGLRRQLLCRQTQLPCRLRCGKPRLCALRPKRAGKLCGLLRPSLLRFKRRLRPLRGGFKPCLAHLCRGPSLLLQDISLELLLGYRLTRSAKSACADSLRRDTLLRNLTLTRNVGQRLLHRRVIVLVHKGLR